MCLIPEAKDLIRQQCSTIEGFQFLCCEHSKIVRYLMTWNASYDRGHWEWFLDKDNWQDHPAEYEEDERADVAEAGG